MTLFFISAALLVLLSLGWLLAGVFRSQGASTDQEAVNITLARERAQTLDAALADGSIDQATYDYEREQLEYDLAADLRLDSERTTRKGGQISAAVIVAVFVPITAGALYLHLGNPAAITQLTSAAAPAAVDGQNAPALADLLPQMEERLAQQPDDVEGWRLLGRSYLSVGEFAKAASAFQSALALDELDVPTLAQLAEATAMTQQGDLSGEPFRYVTRANELDPDNEHALWLLSIAQQQAGDHEAAKQGFDRLASMAGNNPEALATIDQMRARSVEALAGASEGSTASTDTSDDAGAVTKDTDMQADADVAPEEQGDTPATDSSPSIEVTVSASDDARSASEDDQAVFVYAIATQGPPMPLAVSRLSVADLPTTVTLDNSMAMVPTMTLSAFSSVTIGARISTTGNATAQAGDWFSEAGNVDPASTNTVELVIDQQRPE